MYELLMHHCLFEIMVYSNVMYLRVHHDGDVIFTEKVLPFCHMEHLTRFFATNPTPPPKPPKTGTIPSLQIPNQLKLLTDLGRSAQIDGFG